MEKLVKRLKSAFENENAVQVFRLSFLAILSIIASNIHNQVGTVLVGHVGKDSTSQISAMGVALTLFLLFSSPMNSFGSAAQSIISKFWGAGDRKQALFSLKSAVVASFITSLVISFIVFLVGDKMVAILSTDQKVRSYAFKFLLIRILGLPFSAVSFIIRGFFDAIGDPKEHLKFNFYSSLVCIVLSPFFIFGIIFPRLELYGFALASSISSIVAMILGLAYIKDYITEHFTATDIKQESYIRNLVAFFLKNMRVSLPAMGAQFIAVTTFIIFMRASESRGVEHQAATFILINIVSIFMLPSFAIGTTLAGFVGRLVGDRKFRKAKKLIFDTVIIAGVFTAIVSFVFFVFPYHIIDAFSNDENVINIGSKLMRIFSPGLFFLILGMIFINTLVGIGDTKFIIILESLAHLVFLVPSLIFIGIVLKSSSLYIWMVISIYFAAIFFASWFRIKHISFEKIMD